MTRNPFVALQLLLGMFIDMRSAFCRPEFLMWPPGGSSTQQKLLPTFKVVIRFWRLREAL